MVDRDVFLRSIWGMTLLSVQYRTVEQISADISLLDGKVRSITRGGVHLDNAVDQVIDKYNLLRDTFPGKPTVLAEVGVARQRSNPQKRGRIHVERGGLS